MSADGAFHTVIGRGLIEELPVIAHPPYLVVTMADLWPRFRAHLDGPGLGGVHLVEDLELDRLEQILPGLPAIRSVIGLGGGQAVDVAKFVAWRLGLPLFQAPTALSVNAPWGQRAGLRRNGHVVYVGWAVPEAVYVDLDVIASAPPLLNRSGAGDVLCYQTAATDWMLADAAGRAEPRWPLDPRLLAAARIHLDAVRGSVDGIREGTPDGIRTLVAALRWGGAAFHDAGWNPRHIEGMEHFLFYNLERRTGRHFIHGQPVGLGILAGLIVQGEEPSGMASDLHRLGLDVRPEAMGVTWDDVQGALLTLPAFVREAGLWVTAADLRPIDGSTFQALRTMVIDTYGPWEAPR